MDALGEFIVTVVQRLAMLFLVIVVFLVLVECVKAFITDPIKRHIKNKQIEEFRRRHTNIFRGIP